VTTGPSTGGEVAVLSIGDELLSGEVVDTNFPYIVEELSSLGLAVREHDTVADDEPAIAEAVARLAAASDVLIVTGGLGPTNDDVTREGIARAAGVPLVRQAHIEERLRSIFEALGREMAEENLKQAFLPEGAIEIPVTRGTAPGFMIEISDSLVASVPGVPSEMAAMLASDVIPEIGRRLREGGVTVTRKLMTFGRGESDVAALLHDRIEAGDVRYGFLAQAGPIAVKMTVAAGSFEEAAEALDAEESMVRERLGQLVYAVGDVPIEKVVGDMLMELGVTLAVAESCTGGMVCARLTNVPGSSRYFMGGAVTYTPRSKESVLGVPQELLLKGVVSRPVAEAMAKGARKTFGTDIGIAITGLAGPDSAGEDKPVGTVCFGLADASGVYSYEVRLPGDRSMVRSIATMGALNAVRLHLLGVEAIIPR
jgi:nicotinamide-nucleotide amidase